MWEQRHQVELIERVPLVFSFSSSKQRDEKKKLNENDKKEKTIKISFRDSMDLLNYSLEELTDQLNIDLKKGIFPHKFVSEKTINYIGNKPDISFYIKSKKVFTNENKNNYYSIPVDN